MLLENIPIIDMFICAILEYAIICLISINDNADIQLYIIPNIANKITNGKKNSQASGNYGNENLNNPYVPNFNNIAAKITDALVLPSVCANGNQMWNGNIGTFIANDMKNPYHNIYWVVLSSSNDNNKGYSVVPPT